MTRTPVKEGLLIVNDQGAAVVPPQSPPDPMDIKAREEKALVLNGELERVLRGQGVMGYATGRP